MKTLSLTPLAALLILAAPLAWAQDKKAVTPGDVQYHAAPSALYSSEPATAGVLS